MSRTLFALLGGIATALASGAISVAQPPQRPAGPPPSVADGEKIFQASCANQYCHGPGGKGAQGPRLVDFAMAPETISATIREGRSGTPMVAFKNVLEPQQLNSVIAYVMSISSGGILSAAGVPAAPPSPPKPSTVPISIGKEKGTAATGMELFFDANKLNSCRTCHSYDKRGGPLGLDFAVARQTPQEILASLTKPRIASRAYRVITIDTTSGVKLTGVRGPEDEERLQLYDISVPPVRRSFAKSDIAEIQIGKRGIFDHTRLGYSRQQLLDIAALLGASQAK